MENRKYDTLAQRLYDLWRHGRRGNKFRPFQQMKMKCKDYWRAQAQIALEESSGWAKRLSS